MAYDNSDNATARYLGTITVFAIVLLFAMGFGYNAYRTSVESNRKLTETIEIQKQKTERTEERSQFWQKLVPWGADETEAGK